MAKTIPLPHPDETTLEDILTPLNMRVNQPAKHLGIMATRLNEIVRRPDRRRVNADIVV